MINKLQNHLARHWSIYIIGLLYIATRVIFLEADLPPWDTIKYQTIDELYYLMPAYEGLYKPVAEFEHFPVNAFQNLFALIFIKLFGLSYFSLRMTPALMGLLGVGIAYLVYLRQVDNRKEISLFARNIIFVLCAAMIIMNYGFYYSTVVVEPSISITLYSAIMLFVLTRFSGNYQVIGAAIAFGPVFVYPSTLYMSMAVLVALLMVKWREICWCDIRNGLLGGAAVAGSFALLLLIGYKNSWMESLQNIHAQSSHRVLDLSKYSFSYLVEDFIKELPKFNLFNYSVALMVCTGLSFFVLLLISAKQFRRPNLVLVSVLLMLIGRSAQLFFEKTHYERKTIDIALLVLLILLEMSILFWPLVKKSMDQLKIGSRAKSAVATLFVVLGLSLNYSNASVLISDFSSKKSYHNRDTLFELGKTFSGCLAIGEWSHGLNIYGMYDVKLNSYKYTLPSQYGDYSEQLLKLLADKNAIVISSYPYMTQKISDEAKNHLAPVYFFDINDGGSTTTKYAVYRPSNRVVNGESVKCTRYSGESMSAN